MNEEMNVNGYELGDGTLELIERFLNVKKLEAEFGSAARQITATVDGMEKEAILALSTKNGDGELPKSYSESVSEVRLQLTDLQGKIRACGAATADLRAQILASMDMDRRTALAALSRRHQALREDQIRLQHEFIDALAAAKVREIKFRRFHRIWNEKEPGIAGTETDLWDAFHVKVKRLLDSDGINANYLSPLSVIARETGLLRQLERPVSAPDLDEALRLMRHSRATV